ncbi:helix-turn-helix domain-containing protein [Hydrocarboniphaga effusa]|uniref:helix-turn-helix domain-containing protein n=1 Tax=Hydrocarboniphaga effusa TaxID=243629 RepID=UPI00398C06C2
MAAIEEYRIANGLTGSEMAKALNQSRGRYSEFRHGKREVPLKSLRLAHMLGIDAAQLLCNEEAT